MVSFSCRQLNAGVNNGELKIFSKALTDTFVDSSVRSLQSDSDGIDRFDSDEAVEKLVKSNNDGQGFVVVRWFKPAHDEEGVAVEHKKIHKSSVIPDTPLTETQQALKYRGKTL